jgi:hypothetical protein
MNGEPLAVEDVSGRTGMHPTRTRHHMSILDAFGIVGRTRSRDSGQALYVARLDEQPDWVREAVEANKGAAE